MVQMTLHTHNDTLQLNLIIYMGLHFHMINEIEFYHACFSHMKPLTKYPELWKSNRKFC